MGANLSMTRTPDVHFVSEARHEGAKFVVLSPDFSQVLQVRRLVDPGRGRAGRRVLDGGRPRHPQEFHAERQVPYFADYLKRYTRLAVPRRARAEDGGSSPAGMLPRQRGRRGTPARRTATGSSLVWDALTRHRGMPQGTVGLRWQQKKGKWNLRDARTATTGRRSIRASRSLEAATTSRGGVPRLRDRRSASAGVPVRYVETSGGTSPVATVFDLLMAQFGVGRGLPGDYPASYDDDGALHAGLAGEAHRRRPRRRDPLRARVRRQRRDDRRASR